MFPLVFFAWMSEVASTGFFISLLYIIHLFVFYANLPIKMDNKGNKTVTLNCKIRVSYYFRKQVIEGAQFFLVKKLIVVIK